MPRRAPTPTLAKPLALAALLTCAPLLSCAPVADPDTPIDAEDPPCQTDDDCTVRATEKGPRTMLCGNRSISWSNQGKDAAACGPMPNLTMNIPEPVLMCFHGTCVPVGKDR